MDLEHELKTALARKEPDPGFANQVLDAIRSEKQSTKRERRPWRALAAAATLAAILGGVAGQQAAQQAAERRAEGERAQEEVLLALRITSEKLRTAQDHVRHINPDNR